MARKKPIPGQLEIDAKFHGKPHVQKKVRKKHAKSRPLLFADTTPDRGWMVAGFDVAMTNISGAAIAWDAVLKKLKGPVFVERRWTKDDHYFERLKSASNAHEFVQELEHQMLLSFSPAKIFIAAEEPWPFGLVKGGESGWLKQQAQISGAFLGGLVRYGFQNVSEMNTIRWRKVVADELGITTHVSKWKDPTLAGKYNTTPDHVGKFRTKQWAMNPGYAFQGAFAKEVPDFPDIVVNAKLGRIPRPEGSRAKGVQPDDRYDALAVCWAHYTELMVDGILDK